MLWILFLFLYASLSPYHGSPCHAEILHFPQVYPAHFHLTEQYVSEGLIMGGKQTSIPLVLKNLHFLKNEKKEQISLEFESPSTALKHPPYFQVMISPSKNEVQVSLWGEIFFDASKFSFPIEKSQLIKKMIFLPQIRLESYPLTLILTLKTHFKVEVIETQKDSVEWNPIQILIEFIPQSSEPKPLQNPIKK